MYFKVDVDDTVFYTLLVNFVHLYDTDIPEVPYTVQNYFVIRYSNLPYNIGRVV